MRWVDVQGTYGRGSRGSSVLNESEAEEVVRVVRAEHARGVAPSLLGVVTPYRAQVDYLRSQLHDLGSSDGMTIDTAHRFQGDERDVIVFSPVVSTAMPSHAVRFANDANLVNVAVTRARQRLIIVGDRQACLNAGGVLGQLARYTVDLEDGRFESPLERRLYEALCKAGIETAPGLRVGPYRLDLAYRWGNTKLDIECDGASFHRDTRSDGIRDTHLREKGWMVVRFPGRRIANDLESCVAEVLALTAREG